MSINAACFVHLQRPRLHEKVRMALYALALGLALVLLGSSDDANAQASVDSEAY